MTVKVELREHVVAPHAFPRLAQPRFSVPHFVEPLPGKLMPVIGLRPVCRVSAILRQASLLQWEPAAVASRLFPGPRECVYRVSSSTASSVLRQ